MRIRRVYVLQPCWKGRSPYTYMCSVVIGAASSFVPAMLTRLWAREPLREAELRGGWRQRDQQLAAAQVGDAISHLAAGHLKQYADGESSATQLRYHMANAVRDGMEHPTIVKLAANTEGGGNPQRGLKALLEEKVGLLGLQTELEVSDSVTRWEGQGDRERRERRDRRERREKTEDRREKREERGCTREEKREKRDM